jgi:hypothetical protein
MALVVADRVQETTTTSGTGTLSLGGAVSGFQSFVTGIGNGNTTYYAIYDQTAQVWEVGLGTVTSGSPNTLSRTTVLANSSGNTSPITLAGNSSSVFCAYPAGKAVIQDASGNLGVGVASPLQKLDVNGTMRSTSASATGGVQVFNNQSDNTSVRRIPVCLDTK